MTQQTQQTGQATQTTVDGFVTSDDVTLLREVASELRSITPKRDVLLWHSGGGIFALQVPLGDGRAALCGIDDETWHADILDADGEFSESVVLNVPQDIRHSPQKMAQVLTEHFPAFPAAR